MGVKRGIFQSIRFEITKKKVGKRGGHFSTHGCAMDLKVVVIIKRKIINCENHANEATECTSGRTVTSILCGGGGGGGGGGVGGWGVLTRPKWTKVPKCIFYCLIRLLWKVAIHEKL